MKVSGARDSQPAALVLGEGSLVHSQHLLALVLDIAARRVVDAVIEFSTGAARAPTIATPAPVKFVTGEAFAELIPSPLTGKAEARFAGKSYSEAAAAVMYLPPATEA